MADYQALVDELPQDSSVFNSAVPIETEQRDKSFDREFSFEASVIFDEAAMMSKSMTAWSDTIRATLTDYAGDAWFFSTPKGRNVFWELWRRGDPMDGAG